jgi:hypothetical protein
MADAVGAGPVAGGHRADRQAERHGRAVMPRSVVGRPLPQLLTKASAPGLEPRAPTWGCSEWGRVVEVAAALGLPLPALGAVAVAALAGALDLGVAHLREAPTSSASSSVVDRFSPSGGLPAALSEAAGDHTPGRP